MASAFKWKLTDNLFSYLTDTSGGQPQINNGYTASAETIISEQVVTHFGDEQAYAAQFRIMTDMIANNPATSGVTLLNYSYYYDMNENSCGFINGGNGYGGITKGEKGDKGDKGDKGNKGDKGDKGDSGRGIRNIVTSGLTDNKGTRITVILTDMTSYSFDVENGIVDDDYLNALVQSAVTIQVNNVSGYVKNSIVQYVSGEIRDLSHIVQDASSITSTVAHQVCGITTDISEIRQTCSSITMNVSSMTGDVILASQIAQTASGVAISASNTANSANSQCSQLRVDYGEISAKVETVSANMMTKGEFIVTSTAITANIYDEINKKTGIDITSGVIKLDAKKTIVNGELTLSNTNSGFVLYDAKGNPVIRISNDAIGNFEDFNTTIGYSKFIQGEVNQSSWNITTKSQNIGTWGISSNISLKNFGIIEYVEDSGYRTPTYPEGNACTIRVDLIKNNASVDYKTATATRNPSGYYIYNGTITFQNLAGGDYSIRATITGLTGSAPGTNPTIIYSFIYSYDYSNNRLVRLADGGFSSNPAPNSFIWSNSEMQVMRQGNNAIRVYNANGETNSRGFEVLASTTHGDRWVNFSNYMPTKFPYDPDFVDGTAYIGDGGHEDNVKIYTVEKGYGCIIIGSRSSMFPGYRGRVYIKLPPTSQLVMGYRVKIYNIGDDDVVRVIDGDNSASVNYRIMDGNMNMNTYHPCDGGSSGSEFIYIGSSVKGSYTFHWRATTDV